MKNNRKTPIMGWASWNCFRTNITESIMKEQADALIRTGLADCGYIYLNMDDGFFGGRDKNGRMTPHKERFPNGIKVVADYAHSLGLKAGTYTDGGDNTCGHYYDREYENGEGVGLYGHEESDLRRYLIEDGFDFIKVDWCGGVRLGLDDEEQYTKIGRIIDDIREETGRCIVYNICRWQFPGPWAAGVADSWRTGADITPDFESVMYQLDMIKPLARYCSPGHVNDLDMMQIGNGLTHDEEKAHFAMWCMMSTPLMIGCDLTMIKEETLEILKNKKLIAINQDSACLQAFVAKELRDDEGTLVGEVWIKDLGKKDSEEKAIAFLNRSNELLGFDFDLAEAGLHGITGFEDLTGENAAEINGESVTCELGPHCCAVYRVKAKESTHVADRSDRGEVEHQPIVRLSLDEAMELVRNGAYLIDVRSADEYEKGHLEGAINIPYFDIHSRVMSFIPDKDASVVLYCAAGKRSIQAYRVLEFLNYKNAYCLGGVRL